MHTFPDIDRLKATLDPHRPLAPAIGRNLREDLIVRWTYHSNAIEGKTLTLQEAKAALEGITIGGKSIREHLEAVNHNRALLRTQRTALDQQMRGLMQRLLTGKLRVKTTQTIP